MGFRFCFGASGSGKSYQLQRMMLRDAEQSKTGRYFYIVPEQYTMQTEKELVEASSHGGIMNVDVLSFGRLSHRVFSEVGGVQAGQAVLDDIGKSLILRKLAMSCKKDLQVIGGKIDRLGMISEVKSLLSEFMQYGITPEGAGELADYAEGKGQKALALRLRDLQVLYTAFMAYKKDHFVTGEERLLLLAEAIPQSELIRGSVMIFDGFTGFTPVQYKVLVALMKQAKEVVISLPYAEDGGMPMAEVIKSDQKPDEQDLFYLTRKTVRDLVMHAERQGIPHGDDIFSTSDCGCDPGEYGAAHRFTQNPALAHLERELFRYPIHAFESGNSAGEASQAWQQNQQDASALPIELFAASDPEAEARQVCIRMHELIREKAYCYRDFGIVTGDLAVYGDAMQKAARRYDIPVYIDTTREILQNPLTEAVRSVMEIAARDFSYEAVFRYLRSGLSGLSEDEIDRLENYCLAHGVTSKRKWDAPFAEQMEPVRECFLQEIQPLLLPAGSTAAEWTKALYGFLQQCNCAQKMADLAARFAKEGDAARAKEYEQIYRAVLELLEEIYELLGDEVISAGDYLELLESGFAEIRLGTLPQEVDRVLVGDIERTRMHEVKVLFFLGVNDGNIPRSTEKGGIISDLDREFLQQSGEELAPTPRQEMYIQRLYLYLNMTKETDLLIVSYAYAGTDGKSLRPSYLVGMLQQMFPGLESKILQERPPMEQVIGMKDAGNLLAGELRQYADGRYDRDPEGRYAFLTLYHFLAMRAQQNTGVLTAAAFQRYQPKPITKETAEKIYGTRISGSVSRLEQAAQCYLRQFLRYGVKLKERDVYTYTPADAGTVMHDSMEHFSKKLESAGLAWDSFTDEEGRRLSSEALREVAGNYNDQLLYANARNSYQIRRMERVLHRTVETLQYQLRQGEFVPKRFEVDFGKDGGLRFALHGGELSLIGRIDRVDLCEKDDHCYVKIVDYKSGNKDLDVDQIRQGLQLQLMVYMDAVLDEEQGLRPDADIEPAALLYYHFDDPILTGKDAVVKDFEEQVGDEAAKEVGDDMSVESANTSAEGTTESGKEAAGVDPELTDQMRRAVHKSLRPKGLVNADLDVIRLLDRDIDQTSDVIPVAKKKGKEELASRGSHVVTREEFDKLREDVRCIVIEIADHIMEGDITAQPINLGNGKTSCTYCVYRNACGFDPRIPGYRYRDL